eukprot:3088996-Rhodomonas_salina.1
MESTQCKQCAQTNGVKEWLRTKSKGTRVTPVTGTVTEKIDWEARFRKKNEDYNLLHGGLKATLDGLKNRDKLEMDELRNELHQVIAWRDNLAFDNNAMRKQIQEVKDLLHECQQTRKD